MKATLESFADRAAAEGLLDVAYATADSPLGSVLLAATPNGVVRVGLPNQDPDALLEELAARISPRVLAAPARLDEARRQLDRYFEGRLTRFDLDLDWRLTDGFQRRAQRAVARIPYGRTRSYAEIARTAGNARAVRAAGTACGANPLPLLVPCHRVLRSDGSLGGYGGGPDMKRVLLELEGSI